MIEKQTIWHEITRVEDDWRQEVEEEDVSCERRYRSCLGVEEQQADDHAQHDQHARFGKYMGDLRRHVETWKEGEKEALWRGII